MGEDPEARREEEQRERNRPLVEALGKEVERRFPKPVAKLFQVVKTAKSEADSAEGPSRAAEDAAKAADEKAKAEIAAASPPAVEETVKVAHVAAEKGINHQQMDIQIQKPPQLAIPVTPEEVSEKMHELLRAVHELNQRVVIKLQNAQQQQQPQLMAADVAPAVRSLSPGVQHFATPSQGEQGLQVGKSRRMMHPLPNVLKSAGRDGAARALDFTADQARFSHSRRDQDVALSTSQLK